MAPSFFAIGNNESSLALFISEIALYKRMQSDLMILNDVMIGAKFNIMD